LDVHSKQKHRPLGYVQEAPATQAPLLPGKAEGHVAAAPPQLGSGGVTVHCDFPSHVATVVQCGSSPYSHDGMTFSTPGGGEPKRGGGPNIGVSDSISGVHGAPASGSVLGHQGARTTLASAVPLLGPETPPVLGSTLPPQPTMDGPAKSTGTT
jgi:hypothetical protein